MITLFPVCKCSSAPKRIVFRVLKKFDFDLSHKMIIFGADLVFHFSKDLVLVTVILCVIKFYVDRWRIFSLGNKIPGPRAWPILGNAIEFLEYDLDALRKISSYNKIYGTARLWMGSYLHVIICTPENAEIFCRSPELLERTDHFDSYKKVLGDGIFTASGALWKKGKRLMDPSFTYANIQSYFPIMQKNSNKLIQILREKSEEPGFPYHRCVLNCFYDIVSESTMNDTVGAQDGNADILEIVEELMAQMMARSHSVWQQVDFLYRNSAIGKKFYQNRKSIINFFDNQIQGFKKIYFEEKEKLKDETYEKTLKHKVFLHKLLDDQEWSDSELRDQFITMLATGFETTTSAACFAAMMLGIHKNVQEKVYEEVSTALGRDFEVEEMMELEYLDRVVKESMRLYPVGPLTFRLATKDIQFTDYLVPEGSAVGINIFLIHRDPKHWDNPDAYDPDHFLPEKVSKRHTYAYLPFMRGRRKCIASKFAFIEVKLLLAKIILNFKIDCDLTMEDVEREMRAHITIKMRDSHYPIRLTPREIS